MHVLDGDDVRLSSRGRYAERDIVQVGFPSSIYTRIFTILPAANVGLILDILNTFYWHLEHFLWNWFHGFNCIKHKGGLTRTRTRTNLFHLKNKERCNATSFI